MFDGKSVTTSLKPSGVCLTISCVVLSEENCSLRSAIYIKAYKMNNWAEMLMYERLPFSKHSNPEGEIGCDGGKLR